ncbi:kelch repeat-containing protein [Spirosoma flavum]|uniref:Uncharacterized protein n=1 Tax=Spirosoma flavum TaxID=2048557 RepID=A0ABW6ALD8_9BACT
MKQYLLFQDAGGDNVSASSLFEGSFESVEAIKEHLLKFEFLDSFEMYDCISETWTEGSDLFK